MPSRRGDAPSISWFPIEQFFFFDRLHEAFRVRIGIRRLERRLHDTEVGLVEQPSHFPIARPIPSADWHAMMPEYLALRGRQRATDLTHEEIARTVHAVLDRHGLVHRRRGRRARATGTGLSRPTDSNALWCADYKEEFMHGVPFASAHAIYGLTKLAVWWLRLGIQIERMPPSPGSVDECHSNTSSCVPDLYLYLAI